jgi:hypothetical protein
MGDIRVTTSSASLRHDDTADFLQVRVVPDGMFDGHCHVFGWDRCFGSKLGLSICVCFAVHSLRKEKIMAVRVLALLIPLAITLPQLQMSRPVASAPQNLAASVQPAAEPPWSYETRRVADAAMTRVVLESPLQEAVRTIDGPTADTADSAAAAGVTPHARKASPRRAAPKLARAASPVKLVSTAETPGRSATRQAKRLPADAGCPPSVHCAPVVVAKVTPVLRRRL